VCLPRITHRFAVLHPGYKHPALGHSSATSLGKTRIEARGRLDRRPAPGRLALASNREGARMLRPKLRSMMLAALATAVLAAPASAAGPCRNNTGSFERWLDGFKQEAAAQGISRAAISAGLDGMSFDQAIINRDHGQGVFQQTFLQFSDRMV